MTIYAGKSGEKKSENEVPECVTLENVTNLEKEDVESDKSASASARFSGIVNRRGRRLVKICVASAVIVMFICGVILGIIIYNMGLDKIFHGWCDVHYYEYKKGSQSQSFDHAHGSGRRFYQRRNDGSFRQEIFIDLDYGIFERIEIPKFEESRKATVIHDFGKNLTAIADQELQRCFVLPLNRNFVRPPRDLYDMLNKMKMDFYFYHMPEAEIIREIYQANTPPVQHLTAYGYNIMKECQTCNTFLLTKRLEPVEISKRNACELAGDQYCLGDGGTDNMLCIKIRDCV